MKDSIFNELVQNLKQNFDNSDCVYLTSELGEDRIDIFAWRDSNFILEFNDFTGQTTEEQRLVLQSKINASISDLDEHFEDEEPGEEILDMYHYNGVKRETFY